MSMRDLIPWRRQENPAPALFRDEERSPYVQLRREMDRLFEDFFRAPLVGGIGLSSNVESWPYLEVKETDDQVIVTAELPGLTEKDVDVTVDDGVLTLRGEKKSEHQDKDRGWSERYYGRFERSIVLPDGADPMDIRYNMINWVHRSTRGWSARSAGPWSRGARPSSPPPRAWPPRPVPCAGWRRERRRAAPPSGTPRD